MDPLSHLPPSHRTALERFAGLVAESPHNLVSHRARDELISRHLPECVALAELLPSATRRLLDVGSGGGLPGLVIAIVRPDLDVHLLDSTRKKTEFLRETARVLDVAVTVHTGRAEELARPPLAASFDVVTARAVAPLGTLLGWTAAYLAPGGVLYAVKGERWRDELEDAADALNRTGMRVVATPDQVGRQAGDGSTAATPRVVMLARSS